MSKIDELIERLNTYLTAFDDAKNNWIVVTNIGLIKDCKTQLEICKGALENTIACLGPLKDAGQLEGYDLFLIDNALVNSREVLSNTNDKE